jgi:hypothetical protein
MRRRKVAAVETQIVFLFAVIRQRLSRDLPSGNAAAVREYREEQCVYGAALLENVEDLFGPLIDERNGPDLDTDHLPGLYGCLHKSGRERGSLYEMPAIPLIFDHYDSC